MDYYDFRFRNDCQWLYDNNSGCILFNKQNMNVRENFRNNRGDNHIFGIQQSKNTSINYDDDKSKRYVTHSQSKGSCVNRDGNNLNHVFEVISFIT